MALLLPKLIYDSICDLTPEVLQLHEISVLLMDFDNTIVPYTSNIPTPEVVDWFRSVQAAGIQLCVVSNTTKERAPAFCRQYGIDCITHAKKPFTAGIRRAIGRYEAPSSAIALVGDQIYTDVLGANCAGITSILIRPLHLHNIWLKLRHMLEKPWIALGRRRGKT